MFVASWLVIWSLIIHQAQSDQVENAVGGGVAFSLLLLLLILPVQVGARTVRKTLDTKWRRYHLAATKQAEADAIIKGQLGPVISVTKMAQKDAILFLAANPLNSTVLRLSEEAREIRDELERAKLQDKFVFHERGAVRPKDFSRTLIDLAPRFVHFSGHGGPSGAIYLEDDVGQAAPVSAKALRALFRATGGQVHCVLLNACYSRVQAEEIFKCVPYVIGMKKEIGDAAAIAFARGFYRGIGAGREVSNAFEIGVAEMLMYDLPEELTPDLLKR
ncbi:CHAT domain-containing protein [Bradyrhizobium yuanmingense]|uniref:CHAT domain-containing protein n=1 Tax=Bradyrhizobium yuanmingense TaxID=108015 RepID=UPI0021A6DCBF|nr:CHAT domain-containing protein [Bradyrhizobium sp. CB1024]UWU83145.1 CHAT domain-containing protein [Bradyrhizobium sp. CB1024]